MHYYLGIRKPSARWIVRLLTTTTNGILLQFEGLAGVVQLQSEKDFVLFYNSGLNINSSQQPGDQAVVKTMGFSGQISAKEGRT